MELLRQAILLSQMGQTENDNEDVVTTLVNFHEVNNNASGNKEKADILVEISSQARVSCTVSLDTTLQELQLLAERLAKIPPGKIYILNDSSTATICRFFFDCTSTPMVPKSEGYYERDLNILNLPIIKIWW